MKSKKSKKDLIKYNIIDIYDTIIFNEEENTFEFKKEQLQTKI